MSLLSPFFIPTIASSNPGINEWLPISNEYPSAEPPSNASLFLKPLKSITAVSPSSTAPSLDTSSAYLSRICPTSCSISSLVTFTLSFFTFNSLLTLCSSVYAFLYMGKKGVDF